MRLPVRQDCLLSLASHRPFGGFPVDDHAAAEAAEVPPLIGTSRDPNPPAKMRVDLLGLGIQAGVTKSVQVYRPKELRTAFTRVAILLSLALGVRSKALVVGNLEEGFRLPFH